MDAERRDAAKQTEPGHNVVKTEWKTRNDISLFHEADNNKKVECWIKLHKIKLVPPTTKKLFNKDSQPWPNPRFFTGHDKHWDTLTKRLYKCRCCVFQMRHLVLRLSAFQSVPGLQDYTSRTVLAPIVTVTKPQIYRASGREVAKPKLHSRRKKPQRVGRDKHGKCWAASLHKSFTH